MKSSEFVESSDKEVRVTKSAKGKGVLVENNEEAPAPKQKQELNRVPIEETDNAEYDDEEEAPKKSRKKKSLPKL